MGLIDKYLTQAIHGSGPQQAGGSMALLGKAILLVFVYYVTARLSFNFAIPPSVITPLWPPAAIAFCACLRWGAWSTPAIWFGATLAYWTFGLPLPAASMAGIGNSLEPLAAALLVRHVVRRPLRFTEVGDVFKFVGIAVTTSMIAATIGIAALALSGQLEERGMYLAWIIWWLGDATGMIIVAPLILAHDAELDHPRRGPRLLEAGILAVLLPTGTFLVFSNTLGPSALAFLPIPFLIWAAFRFNLSGVAWATGSICVIAVWNTARGHGPFSMSDRDTSLLLVMLYTAIIETIGLALCNLISQHRSIAHRLLLERDSLERRVQERTSALQQDVERRKRVEQELATRERQLAEAQHLAQLGSWNWDIESNAITWSNEHYRLYCVDPEHFSVTLDNCRALIHEEDLGMLTRVIRESRRTGQPFHVEHRIVCPDGKVKTVAARGFVTKDESGRVVRMFGTTQDISDAKRAELALREAEERYRMVVELCPDAILVHQDGIITFANQAAAALLGASDAGQLKGKDVLPFIHPEFHETARQRFEHLQRGEAIPRIEEKFIRMDGSSVDVDIHSAAFMHKGKFAVLLIIRDITERKKSAEQLAYLAHYDSLTGLPNRMLFHQRLAHALSLAQRPGKSLEILFLDLDRFKNINDTLGHAAGDMVLKETAQRLQSILRESDTVARLGGDEFVVLVENVDEPHRGGTIAEKILTALAPPFMKDKEPLSVTASIGISSFPSDGTDAQTLLKKADVAMYRAKEAGRSAYRYYSSEMNIHTAERLILEYALGNALQAQQLSLLYQPKVDVLSNRITGMEALLRWDHPTLGSVPPQIFIPLAEETGLIGSIGKWVIRTACMQNKLWQTLSDERLKVAVNLSPRQLADDNLIADIREILDETKLDSRYLELEITESAVMAHPDKAIEVLYALREIGISVAIDDFGIGYSSLAYLKKFPIRAVKIDRSFVQGVTDNHDDAVITKAIISLAHNLECTVIAEGAETQQQFDFLREHDCDSVQGYYFSKPLSVELFSELLESQTHPQEHVRMH